MNLFGLKIHTPTKMSLILTSIISISAYLILKYLQAKNILPFTETSIYTLTFACAIGSFFEGIGISVKDNPIKSILLLSLVGIPFILLAYALAHWAK